MKRPKKRQSPTKKPSVRPVKIELVMEDSRWRRVSGLEPQLRRAIRSTLKAAAAARPVHSLTVLLAGDKQLRALNHDFRGKDKPTNVLSFAPPAGDDGYLGDIAIAYDVSAREARAEAKSLRDHVTHLAVHGTLHLLGHDHAKTRQAEKMEALETDILDGLGIADPYAPRRKKAA